MYLVATEEKRNLGKILVRNLKGREYLEGLDIDERILNEYGVRM
jgi:hypothetical protein